MNKKLKLVALGSMLAASSTVVHAALSGGEILNFADGITSCAVGGTYPDACTDGAYTVAEGSYFAMNVGGSPGFDPGERVAISNVGTGLTLGVAQVIGTIDAPWPFGGANEGRHHTSSNGLMPTVNMDGSVNMNGWTVYWGASGAEVNIDMGTGANATVDCGTGTCADGETFTLYYETVVPSGQPFEGVPYALYLEGTVVVTSGNTAPTAVDDAVTVFRSSTNSLNILQNDTDPESNIDIKTIIIQTVPADGTATPEVNGTVTYVNNGTTLAPDSFTYTVKDTDGLESASATVTITVENKGVFAAADAAGIDTSAASFIDIDVTANDEDGDGFGIDDTSLIITQAPTHGSATYPISGGTGIINYTPVVGYIGTDILKYTVENTDPGGATLSNEATVTISVANTGRAVLEIDDYLIFNTGNVTSPQVAPALGEGSWFSMGVLVSGPTYTPLVGFDHLHLGESQLASSPDDDPFIPLVQNIDQAWTFFGQLGVSQTIAPPTILTDDGLGNVTLDFSPWNVSWNGIPEIALDSGLDNGIATLTCFTDLIAGTPGDCSHGDEFLLVYHATVPEGDPSNFGGVSYVLHLEGVISDTGVTVIIPTAPNTDSIQSFTTDGTPLIVLPGNRATAASNATGSNLSASDIGLNDPLLNPKDGEQCFGGCVDFSINNVTTAYADIVFRLSKPLPQGAIYRKYINGKWANFNLSAGDLVSSNADNGAGFCTDAEFKVGLREGNQCILLRIYDGGPNDADGVVNGTIVDPSGALLAGSQNVPASSTSGCSISNGPVSIVDRADWLLVAAFLAVLGLVSSKRRKYNA